MKSRRHILISIKKCDWYTNMKERKIWRDRNMQKEAEGTKDRQEQTQAAEIMAWHVVILFPCPGTTPGCLVTAGLSNTRLRKIQERMERNVILPYCLSLYMSTRGDRRSLRSKACKKTLQYCSNASL
jgi:hypothetical protein